MATSLVGSLLLVGLGRGRVLGFVDLVGEGVAGSLSAVTEALVGVLGDVLVGLLGGSADGLVDLVGDVVGTLPEVGLAEVGDSWLAVSTHLRESIVDDLCEV